MKKSKFSYKVWEKLVKKICLELNNSTDLEFSLRKVISQIKGLLNCEGAAIRLKRGKDYPYYVYEGFPASFIAKENTLIKEKDLTRCFCGLVLRGEKVTCPTGFTKFGSFWSGNISALTLPAYNLGPEKKPENACQTLGYKSLALIPLKARGGSLGLIQLNDKSEGLFSPEIMDYLEIVGQQITLAVQNNILWQKMHKLYNDMGEMLDELPVALTTFDKNLKLTYINKRAEEITGYAKKELEGLAHREITHMIYGENIFHPPVFEELRESIHRIKNRIRTIRTKKGDYVKVCFDVTRLRSGGYLYLFDEARKIQALENLELQTQTILNAFNNLVLIIDSNYKIIMCNTALTEALEMDSRDILDKNLFDLMEAVQFSRKDLASKTLHAINFNDIYQVFFVTPRGNKREVIVQFAPIYNVDEELMGVIAVASDLTSLKREQERQQHEKLALLGKMATGIVHEIKNPLTAIQGFSQIIRLKAEKEALREYARLIEEEVRNLNKIVSDFLTFARPRPPVLQEISLNDIVESMQLILESNTLPKGIKVHYQLAKNAEMIRVDQNQVKQVILNIVQNAIDALMDTPDPEIRIITGRNPSLGECFITIHNNGKSMTEEEKRLAGTPFFTTKSKGTGLGLSVCQQIIKEHGGRLDFISEPNQGTAFTLFFPCYTMA